MLDLAIKDPKYGLRIRQSRILRPDERKVLEVVQQVRKELMSIGQLDSEMNARLEAALDDPIELGTLTSTYLDEESRLRLGYWPSEEPYRVLDEGTAIKEFIVKRYREDLRPFGIVVVFQEEVPPVNRRGRLGTMTKLPGKMKFLTQYDAVVSLGFREWTRLTDADRQRLVHHELEHLEVIEGKVGLRGHDFEDFASIVGLYGLRSESERFSTDGEVADVLEQTGSQYELMEAHG